MDALAASPRAPVAALAAQSRPWLAFWRAEFGVGHFHPFDLLAAARVSDPSLVACETTDAWIVRGKSDAVTLKIASHTEGEGKAAHGRGVASKMYLHVGDARRAPVARTATRKALAYCHSADPRLRATLVSALAGGASPRPDL